jgi:glycosyltransferase involved in cell wall biosynthesis
MKQLIIAMLGDSLEHQGGIVTVEKLILKYAPSAVKIDHIATYENKSTLNKLTIFARSLLVLPWYLLTTKPDLIHIHISDWGSVLRKAIIIQICLLFRIPILVHAHGPEFHLTYQALPRAAQKYLGWLFQHCTGSIVLSKSWQDFYIENLGLQPEKVFILPNPVELPLQIPDRTNKQKITIVFTGKISQRKGSFDLIQAFAQLPFAQQECSKLILAGDGEIATGKELAESLNLANNIEFLGWIDSEQRNTLLSEADIFILPSYNEALPMALLEAMAWGLPVITTPVGGIPEIVTSNHNGLLVPPGDLQQLSSAMKSLIINEDLRLSLGTNARSSVVSLDVTSYCVSLGNIYQSIATTKK